MYPKKKSLFYLRNEDVDTKSNSKQRNYQYTLSYSYIFIPCDNNFFCSIGFQMYDWLIQALMDSTLLDFTWWDSVW